jgi:hypothetical protein
MTAVSAVSFSLRKWEMLSQNSLTTNLYTLFTGALFQRKKAGMSGGKRLPNYCCHGKDCNSPHDKTPVKPIGWVTI